MHCWTSLSSLHLPMNSSMPSETNTMFIAIWGWKGFSGVSQWCWVSSMTVREVFAPLQCFQQVFHLLQSWSMFCQSPISEFWDHNLFTLYVECFFLNSMSAVLTLESIHCAGILHGDICLKNILVSDARVTVIDFRHATTKKPRIKNLDSFVTFL